MSATAVDSAAVATEAITGEWPPLTPSSASVSERMSAFPRRDTSPERQLRAALHARGLRYRVCLKVPHMARRTIDIAFTRAKVAVFVDGCFWHGCPSHFRLPRTNGPWWTEKIRRNRLRDAQTTKHLVSMGWQVLRYWEHEDPLQVADRVEAAVLAARTGAAST